MFTRELVKCSPGQKSQMSRILVVEDEDLIREMLVLTLKEGYAIATLLMGERFVTPEC